ncbi:MAG: hypothetical protein IPL33_19300 [Sphingobacteriales bacterium]|nr:hypothetical protein [Sphingobacteriales bacterium]
MTTELETQYQTALALAQKQQYQQALALWDDLAPVCPIPTSTTTSQLPLRKR